MKPHTYSMWRLLRRSIQSQYGFRNDNKFSAVMYIFFRNKNDISDVDYQEKTSESNIQQSFIKLDFHGCVFIICFIGYFLLNVWTLKDNYTIICYAISANDKCPWNNFDIKIFISVLGQWIISLTIIYRNLIVSGNYVLMIKN